MVILSKQLLSLIRPCLLASTLNTRICSQQIHMSQSRRHVSSFTLNLPPLSERPLTPSPLNSPRRQSISFESPSGSLDEAKQALLDAVCKRGTKASSTSIDNDVKKICQEYSQLDVTDKEEFLIHIAKTLATNHDHVTDLIKQMPKIEIKTEACAASSLHTEALMRWEDRLRQSLEPPYHWLATQISRLTGGVKFLVDLREDLLNVLGDASVSRQSQTDLKVFDAHLRDLLSLWFTVGLLELQRITWESPCDILQKISSSMSKIVQNQRYLSFDDSSMKMGEDFSTITTAIFYSITSTQKGLKGIELGNYLIKKVVKELQGEIPHLSQFSSLSPIPGFVKWLDSNIIKAQRDEQNLFTSSELESLQKELNTSDFSQTYGELRRLFRANGWARDDNLKIILEQPLMRLCAFYLYREKRRGFALDPVANFHLRNGAVMWRLNWNADKSPRGMDNSCGIMVNYRYFLDSCESNSKNYLETSSIFASETILYLVKMAENIFKNQPL